MWARGDWRIADKHRLSLAYTQIDRSSELASQKDIELEGNTILAGASLSSSVKTHVFDIGYIYSFYKRPNIELGVTAGLYWMNSLAEVAGSGNVILEGDDQEQLVNSFSSSQRLIAPLPLLGITADYALNDKWIVRGTARFFFYYDKRHRWLSSQPEPCCRIFFQQALRSRCIRLIIWCEGRPSWRRHWKQS